MNDQFLIDFFKIADSISMSIVVSRLLWPVMQKSSGDAGGDH